MKTILTVVITAIATNAYQIINKIIDYRKEINFKKIDIYESNQRNAIVKFSESVGSFMDNAYEDIETNRLVEYYKSAMVLIAYFPNLNYELITSLGDSLDSGNKVIAKKLSEIIKEISKLQSETK